MGFGAATMSGLLAEGHVRAGSRSIEPESGVGPLAPRAPHFAPRAKRVIHIFANGGPSHIDTFDPKPALDRYHGQPLPGGSIKTERRTGSVMRSPFPFQKCGQSGIEVSSLFPEVARHVDDLTVIRSMQADLPNHEPSLMLMNCGDARMVRPSMGSWLTYGLGSECRNLPGFMVLCPGGYPVKEAENWQSAFLPGVYAGTYLDTGKTDGRHLIENLHHESLSLPDQRRQLDLVRSLNEEHAGAHAHEAALEARIQSYETAYRMQTEATDALDISQEPRHIQESYGNGAQGRQLLMARRLVERGVRFVQVWHGEGQPWDSHTALRGNHTRLAQECDQPIAALLADLKQRGMLKDTLVIWGGEFGRTPTVEMKPGGDPGAGRDHNPFGFTMWMAGGGVRGGYVHGATDEFGFRATEKPMHVHDLHATVLHLMGIDHTQLTYSYAGRDFRLTDVHGRVVRELLA